MFKMLISCQFEAPVLIQSFLYFKDKLHLSHLNSPRTTPSGRKVCGGERKKTNNPKNSGHFVPQQRLRAAHALRSDQFQVMGHLFRPHMPFSKLRAQQFLY